MERALLAAGIVERDETNDVLGVWSYPGVDATTEQVPISLRVSLCAASLSLSDSIYLSMCACARTCLSLSLVEGGDLALVPD